jgi:hypothetical protein
MQISEEMWNFVHVPNWRTFAIFVGSPRRWFLTPCALGGRDIRALQCVIQFLAPGQRGLFQSRNDSRLQCCHRGTTAGPNCRTLTQLPVMLCTIGLVVIARSGERKPALMVDVQTLNSSSELPPPWTHDPSIRQAWAAATLHRGQEIGGLYVCIHLGILNSAGGFME